MKRLRTDALGQETQFVIVDALTSPAARQGFEDWVTAMALGYTRIHALGGWKGATEAITIYRVASLDHVQRMELVKLLLNTTRMTDLYVVIPGGHAFGYCYEEETKQTMIEEIEPEHMAYAVGEHDAPPNRPRWTPDMIASKGSVLHGRNDAFQGHGRPPEPLHGARDTGWSHARRRDTGWSDTKR